MLTKYDVCFPPDAGYLYALVNSSWPGVVKIGYAGSIKRRFYSYQTGDPYRAYRMIGWSDVLIDARAAEAELHRRFKMQCVNSEWFRITEAQALAAINEYRAKPIAMAPAIEEEEPAGWLDITV